MHAIVSLFDPKTHAQMEDLWADLRRATGHGGPPVPGSYPPHVSHHAAASYNLAGLAAALGAFARGRHSFQVRASGLGIFTGPEPVLYLPVIRTAELSALHVALWDAIEPCATDPSPYCSPEQWMPHITLAMHDIDAAVLGQAVALLGARPLTWDITVDNLAYIEDLGDTAQVRLRVPLG